MTPSPTWAAAFVLALAAVGLVSAAGLLRAMAGPAVTRAWRRWRRRRDPLQASTWRVVRGRR